MAVADGLAERALEAVRLLRARYPDARCELDHADPWQLLCATILSAQCTDARVNQVTPALFARYPGVEALAAADSAAVEEIVRSTGFFREKTRNLLEMSQDVVARYGGSVPTTLDELVTLRGVGRKTANVLIGVAFGGQAVVVDTHVRRISRLLGWTENTEPARIEQDLMDLLPADEWTPLAHRLIRHGREICVARRPRCADCALIALCPSAAP